MSQKKVVLKKVFILFLIGFTLQSAAQNNDCLVDMNGIGALKIGMRQAELEKMLNQNLYLKIRWIPPFPGKIQQQLCIKILT